MNQNTVNSNNYTTYRVIEQFYIETAKDIYNKAVTMLVVILANHILCNNFIKTAIGSAVGAAVICDCPIIVLIDKFNPCSVSNNLRKLAKIVIKVDLNNKKSINELIQNAVSNKITPSDNLKFMHIKDFICKDLLN